MKYLEIKNDGLLDPKLIPLMGGSTKTSDSQKIGQFGTGLKYVLAYAMRNDVALNLFIGTDKVEISVEYETIQGTEFGIIYINGEKTSITTNMGLDWKPWMIVRELYSNALDEGGAYYGVSQEESGELGKTTFQIELTPDFMAIFNDWSKYFIVELVPIFENENYAVYTSGKTMNIYKQGILIKETNHKSLFNYDVKHGYLNELREFKGSVDHEVYQALAKIDKNTIEYFLENIIEEHYEANLDYEWNGEYSTGFRSEWSETIGSAKIIHKKAVDDIKARGLDIDLTGTLVVPEKVYKHLTKTFEGIGALRVAKKVGDFYEIMNPVLEDKLNKGLSILESVGYFMEPELKYIFGVFGDSSVLAKIIIDKKEIWISEKHADKSMFDFLAMLIEENEHYRTGFQDHSRQFQQHWIDLYTKSILDKAGVEL